METIVFSLREQYLFCFITASTGPTIFTALPFSISDKELRFQVLDRYKPEIVCVNKEDILAIKAKGPDTVAIRGYYGRYRILNRVLFNTFVTERLLELQRI